MNGRKEGTFLTNIVLAKLIIQQQIILLTEELFVENAAVHLEEKYGTPQNERLRRVIWRSNKKYEVKGRRSCDNEHIVDKILYQTFMNTFNALIENKDYFMEKWDARKMIKNFSKIIV